MNPVKPPSEESNFITETVSSDSVQVAIAAQDKTKNKLRITLPIRRRGEVNYRTRIFFKGRLKIMTRRAFAEGGISMRSGQGFRAVMSARMTPK